MIDADPDHDPEAERVEAIVRTGMPGAVVLTAIATAIVIAIWMAFYFLVFVPRGPVP